jgi:hypothetical protein
VLRLWLSTPASLSSTPIHALKRLVAILDFRVWIDESLMGIAILYELRKNPQHWSSPARARCPYRIRRSSQIEIDIYPHFYLHFLEESG